MKKGKSEVYSIFGQIENDVAEQMVAEKKANRIAPEEIPASVRWNDEGRMAYCAIVLSSEAEREFNRRVAALRGLAMSKIYDGYDYENDWCALGCMVWFDGPAARRDYSNVPCLSGCVPRIPPVVFRKILVVTKADVDWLDFYELAYEWKQNRKNISAFGGDTRDPNYLRIIGMGVRAVPCILRQIRNEMLVGEPDHWFTALWAITGENPVPEESQGRIREMARAWLAWGDRQGRGNAKSVGTRISAAR